MKTKLIIIASIMLLSSSMIMAQKPLKKVKYPLVFLVE